MAIIPVEDLRRAAGLRRGVDVTLRDRINEATERASQIRKLNETIAELRSSNLDLKGRVNGLRLDFADCMELEQKSNAEADKWRQRARKKPLIAVGGIATGVVIGVVAKDVIGGFFRELF